MPWVERERAIVGRYRFLVAIHSNEQVATIVPGVDMTRIREDGSIDYGVHVSDVWMPITRALGNVVRISRNVLPDERRR